MKYIRRFLSFVASRMVLLSIVVALLILAFYLAMNTANIYILLNDGMTARTSVILTRQNADELTNYFTNDFLLSDETLNIGLSDASPYIDYNITDFNYKLSLEWVWAWPWENSATATIVVVSHGTGDAEGDAPLSPTPAATSANLVRVYAEKGATVHLVEVVAMGDERQHLEGIGLVAEDGARVDARQYLLGGGRVAVGFEADLAGDAATLDLDSRYIVRHHEVLDVNHAVLQRGERTRCDIQTSGILADAGQKTMRETIDLRHGGHGSKGNERETVLVTGDDIVNRTLPVILCDEDDVAGNHGASIGSVSSEQMTYLADRGLSDAEAEALFARALFDDAVIHAPEHQSLSAALDRAANVVGDDMAHDLASGLGIEPASADDPKEE